VWVVAGNMFAGGIAGMTVEATLFPLDTLKTRLQTRVKGQPISFKGMYRGVPGNHIFPPHPTSPAQRDVLLRRWIPKIRKATLDSNVNLPAHNLKELVLGASSGRRSGQRRKRPDGSAGLCPALHRPSLPRQPHSTTT